MRTIQKLPEIERHKAAIIRTDLSRPVRLALESNLFEPGISFLDYGCGHGSDVLRIGQLGFNSNGWDPYYFPSNSLAPADIVNLGYIINVIETPIERKDALIKAWSLTKKVLIVAAQVIINDSSNGQIAYEDGVITRRNTFQKYYDQQELKTYIDETLLVDAVPVALGVYFIFRDETSAQSFRASRFQRKIKAPKVHNKILQFEDYRQILDPLMKFFTNRGRLPLTGELPNEKELISIFGNTTRAFAVILQATNKEEWDTLSEKHQQDLLVYLALSKFGQRPKNSDLPADLQNDFKAFWGTYKNACDIADKLLFSLGDQKIINSKCKASKIGKLVGDALYIHVSALETLDSILRLYEGCASRAFGRMDGATIIKLRIDKPKISYLFYPNFDKDPHPALQASMQIDFRTLHVSYRDYSSSNNPPILHRKETFVTDEYPNYEKFAKLTRQEEKWELLDDSHLIGMRNGWMKRLNEKNVELKGHRIIRKKVNSKVSEECL